MESSNDLNKDAAAFESKEPSSSIFGFSPIDEPTLDTPKEESSEATTVSGLTESQNSYLAQQQLQFKQ